MNDSGATFVKEQFLYFSRYSNKVHTYAKYYVLILLASCLIKSVSDCFQIMLYDATRRLLVSRFLKKNENIDSGESVTFDGYLVDIGECKGDQKPPKDISPRGKHIKELGKRGPVHGEVAVLNKLLAGTPDFAQIKL